MSKKQLSASQRKQLELTAKFRARCPFIAIRSREEFRPESPIFEAAAAAGYETRFWDLARGFTDLNGKVIMGDVGQNDPDGALDAIWEYKNGPVVWVMRRMLPFITPPLGLSGLNKLCNMVRPDGLPNRPADRAQTIVLLLPTGDIPPELSNSVQMVDWPLPDRLEIGEILDAAVAPVLLTDPDSREDAAVFRKIQKQVLESTSGTARDLAVDAAIGLSGEEAQSSFAISLVQASQIDPVAISQEKANVLAKGGVLRIIPPLTGGFLVVGGLENVKEDLTRYKLAYSPEAREYGVTAPKGIMLMGVSGCGKSHIIRALGAEWGVPIIDLDLGGLKGKYVGQSEQNLRNALEQIGAFGPAIVRIDEVEKALAGASGEAGDGGVSADALGTILTWMQDRPGEAFVIATCNDASKLPPEFLRKGRFDEVYWVDLPTRDERAGVLASALRLNGRNAADILGDGGLGDLLDATEKFNGAEIAALVQPALYVGFVDNRREITTDDLVNAAKNVIPLAKTAESKIKALREMWLGRARPASKPVTVNSRPVKSLVGRALDL
jgi:ATP-dependent 26S proteasome regulatory subunit